ncbi:MAG: hypothetical protein ACRC2H_00015 [Silanimonas sp.]
MRTFGILAAGGVLLALTACSPAPSESTAETAPDDAAASTPAAAPAPSVDAEYEQLKAATPVDACALLTTDKLKAVFPDLDFKLHQELKPQLSGYVWDSRCTYWAGVGTQEFAKDVPTHTVEIFVGTSANEEKARRNLASRHETAVSATGYQAQAALSENAYSTANTGVVSLFFVKGQSEVQINVSDLTTSNEQKVQQTIALAQSL